MMRNVFFVLFSLLSLQALCQEQVQDIPEKYAEFRKQYPGVRIDLTFNQDRYAPGDTVWFKAYFLNSDGSKVKGRQLLDLSVVSADASVLQHFLFSVSDGIGFNQFVFPEVIPSGIYTVAVYSSWMMNFNPPPVFSKELLVVREKEVYADQGTNTHLNELNVEVFPTMISFSAKEGSMLRYQQLYFVKTQNDRMVVVKPFQLGLKSNETLTVDYVPGHTENAVFDKAGRVITAWEEELDTNRFRVNIEASNGGFKVREKTSLAIALVDQNNRPVEGEFSLTVLNYDKQNKTQSHLAQALGSKTGEPWGQILSGRRNDDRYSFTTNLFRAGTAYRADGTPLPGGATIVFYLQYNDQILQATTMAGGKFTLPLRDIARGDEMLAFAEIDGQNVSGLKIVWNQKPVKLPLPLPSHEGPDDDAFGVFASTKKLIDKAFTFYGGIVSNEPINPADSRNESLLEERINGADVSVDVQKYVAFQTMDELIREVVPALQSRKVKGKPFVQVALREPMVIASADPVFIIDGTVTRNTEFFLAIKPSDVAVIKVVTTPSKLLPLGLIGKNGIVIVETFKGNLRPEFESWQRVEGINPAIQFKQRKYKQSDLHKPDIRSTIFWAPTVSTDAQGKALVEFVHSDDTGMVMVIVNGRTKDGKTFREQKTFQASLK